MGFAMTANKGDKSAFKKVGSYGSETALSAILLAGYAAGNWSESKRVRRWIRPADSSFRGDKYNERLAAEAPGLPRQFDITRSLRDLNALLAFNHNNCHWVEFEKTWNREGNGYIRTIDRGLKLSNKPVTCPILTALVLLDAKFLEETPVLTATDANTIAVAVEAVLPLLVANVWHEEVVGVLAVLRFAVENDVSVQCG